MSKNEPSVVGPTIQEIRRRFSNYEHIRVWPEWCSPGLWAPRYIGATPVGGFIDLDDIEISAELKEMLIAWHEKFDAQSPLHHMMTEIEQSVFDAEGLNIAVRLSSELGPAYVIEYEIAAQNLLFKAGECVAVFERPPAPADP